MTPFDALLNLLSTADPGPIEGGFPVAQPNAFSLPLAARLMELCAAAKARRILVAFHQGIDTYLAFPGPPLDEAPALFNIEGYSRVSAEPFMPDGGMGRVYWPFLRSYRARAPEIKYLIVAARRIWFTGHGLGAVDATLAAAKFASRTANNNETRQAVLYTFGSPRVGDAAFVKAFPVPAFRIVNDRDVMAEMPPPWTFRHLGQHKLIDANGCFFHQPTPLRRFPQLLRQTAWLGVLLREWLASGILRPNYTVLRQVLGDHSTRSYLKRLRAAAQNAPQP